MLHKNTAHLKQDLEEMVILLKQQQIQVILLAEPQPNILGLTRGLDDAKVYKEIAKEYDVLLLDNIFSKYLSKQELKSDLIHLNANGYRLVAKDIEKRLKKAKLINE